MLKTTQWRPDTCDCIIEYSWDDSVPAEEREHVDHTMVKVCDAHQSLVETTLDSDIADIVKNENISKNKAIQAIAENNPEYATTVLNDDGTESVAPDLKRVRAKYDENRELHIVLDGVETKEASRLQDIIESSEVDVAVSIR